MDDLAAFYAARLDEDEQAARAAFGSVWCANAEHDEVLTDDGEHVADGFALSSRQLRATVDHIALHDPARVLREVAAKRRIVDTYTEVDVHPNRLVYGFMQQQWVALRAVMAALALPYADHPDYREEWKPV